MGPWSERRLATAISFGLALGVAMVVPNAALADNPACPGADSSTATSCTYTTPQNDQFTVPNGVSSLDVVAVGAAGGTGVVGGSPGEGASVEDTAVPVSFSEVLGVAVGSPGANGSVTVGGAGGTPGGGNAGDPPPNGNADAVDDGGGGGGYSGLLDASQTPLVIAAGGGGSGGGGASFAGGAGGSGDIGSGGGPGGNGFPVSKGGGGGSSSSGGGTLGTGGCFAGDGSGGGFLQGGQGGNSNGHENSSGGGGGGGYYGGGGGGGDCYAAGGGGGSSYGVTGLTNEVNTTAPASVTISWTNATSTSVSCVPGSVLVGVSSTCTATVTDAASTPSVPTGQVNFTASQPDDPFSGSPCTLAPVDGSTDQARCQVTFTPGREPWVKVTGTYTSDTTHTASSGGQPVKVHLRATKTGLMCAPRLAAGQPSTCTATVTDTAPGQASTPTGTVRFSGGSDDSFSASTCALQPVSATTASCQVTDTPPGPGGKDTISARYTSDYSHLGSTGHRTLRVNRP